MIFSFECDRRQYCRRLYILQHIDLRHYPILVCKITVSLTQESILCCTCSDLRSSFRLLFPYCTCVVKISAQKLCITIKRWLPGSCECFPWTDFYENFANVFCHANFLLWQKQFVHACHFKYFLVPITTATFSIGIYYSTNVTRLYKTLEQFHIFKNWDFWIMVF